MGVRIVCDSAADIPQDLAAKYEITVVPLDVRVGDRDASAFYNAVDRFWDAVAQTGERPVTAAPSPERVRALIQPLVEAGHEVLAITLTARLSAVHRVFQLAAAAFGGRVHVFDSRNLSLGAGVLTIEGAKLAQAGHSLQDIVARLHELRPRVRLQAILDTLEWAERGGRIASLMPLIRRSARWFRVKTLLHVVEGEVRLLGIRRTWQAAVETLIQETTRYGTPDTLWVIHTRRQEAAQALAQRLATLLHLPQDRVPVHEAGPILASHVGPGALGTVTVSQ